MKSVIFALVAVASIAASASQDLSGCKISTNGKYATCLVKDQGEDGGQSYITFKIRKGSAAAEADLGCPAGDGGYTACKQGKIPQILKDLNQAFLDAGFEVPTEPDLHVN